MLVRVFSFEVDQVLFIAIERKYKYTNNAQNVLLKSEESVLTLVGAVQVFLAFSRGYSRGLFVWLHSFYAAA